jgi:hypothetical protein
LFFTNNLIRNRVLEFLALAAKTARAIPPVGEYLQRKPEHRKTCGTMFLRWPEMEFLDINFTK